VTSRSADLIRSGSSKPEIYSAWGELGRSQVIMV